MKHGLKLTKAEKKELKKNRFNPEEYLRIKRVPKTNGSEAYTEFVNVKTNKTIKVEV